MEMNEVSRHELVVYAEFSRNPDQWFSNAEIAGRVKGVAIRTVRNHTKRLTDLGVLDQAEVFPGHRFRLSGKARQRNAGYVNRLRAAASVFGIEV